MLKLVTCYSNIFRLRSVKLARGALQIGLLFLLFRNNVSATFNDCYTVKFWSALCYAFSNSLVSKVAVTLTKLFTLCAFVTKQYNLVLA